MKQKLVAALVTVILMGCVAVAGIPGAALAGGGSLPAPNAEAVYDYITGVSPYRQWDLFPDHGKLYRGRHPHGALLTTYVNEMALRGISSGSETLPAGTIIVKENYLPDQRFDALTVMYRAEGYNPEAGDWFWAKYGVDGAVEDSGKVEACIDCHRTAVNNDWIFTGR